MGHVTCDTWNKVSLSSYLLFKKFKKFIWNYKYKLSNFLFNPIRKIFLKFVLHTVYIWKKGGLTFFLKLFPPLKDKLRGRVWMSYRKSIAWR